MTAAAALTLATPAHAGVIDTFGGVNSETNGIVYDAARGTFWVVEEYTAPEAVVEMTPAGQVIKRVPVGADPESIALGPNDTVWVSLTGAKQLAWFAASAATPTVNTVGDDRAGKLRAGRHRRTAATATCTSRCPTRERDAGPRRSEGSQGPARD